MPMQSPSPNFGRVTTPSNTYLSGVTQATVAVRFRINSEADQTSAMDIFRKAASNPFTFGRIAAGYRVVWTFNVGNDNLIFPIKIVYGKWYHLVTTFDSNVGSNVYLDKNLILTDTSSVGLSLKGAKFDIELGTTSIIDCDLDKPAIWTGIALSQNDINLLGNGIDPTTFVTGLVFAPPFSGVVGNVNNGDFGLSDPIGPNIGQATQTMTISNGTPTWTNESTAISPALIINSGFVGTGQQSATVVVTDPAGNPLNIQGVNGPIYYRVNSGVWNPCLSGTYSVNCPYVFFGLSQTNIIGSSDTVEISGSANSIISNGYSGLGFSLRVTNYAGTEILTINTARSSVVGQNIDWIRYYNPFPMYNNLYKHGGPWSNGVIDVSGNLLSLPVNTSGECVVANSTIGASGYVSIPSGTYTLYWPTNTYSPFQSQLFGNNATTQLQFLSGIYDSNIQKTVSWYSLYYLNTTRVNKYLSIKTSVAPIGSFEVYMPGSDTTKIFNQNFLTKVSGYAHLRFMNAQEINLGNTKYVSDLRQPTHFCYGFPAPSVQTVAPILSYQSYNDSGNFFNASSNSRLELVTSGLHNLYDGSYVSIAGGSVLFTDGSTSALNQPYLCHVTSPSSLAISPPQMTKNVVNMSVASGTTATNMNGHMPIQDMVSLVNALPKTNLWINIWNLADTGLVDYMFDYIGANLKPDRKCYGEYSNEHWNQSGGFSYSLMKAFASGDIDCINADKYFQNAHSLYYSKHSNMLLNVASGAMARHGRDRDLIRVAGSQLGGSQYTKTIMNFASFTGLAFDKVCVAYYYEGLASNVGSFGMVIDGFTMDLYTTNTLLDFHATNLIYNKGFDNLVAGHTGYIASYGANLISYEGSVDALAINGNNSASQSRDCGTHPRYVPIYWQVLSKMEAQGMNAVTHFQVGGAVGKTYVNQDSNWPTYQSYNQLPGRGDGSDGKNDNRVNPQDYANNVSTSAFAQLNWTIQPPGFTGIYKTLLANPMDSMTSYQFAMINIATSGGGESSGNIKPSPINFYINHFKTHPYTIVTPNHHELYTKAVGQRSDNSSVVRNALDKTGGFDYTSHEPFVTTPQRELFGMTDSGVTPRIVTYTLGGRVIKKYRDR